MLSEEIELWVQPPMSGGVWLIPRDRDVSSVYYHSEYFWTFRTALQIRIQNDVIVEAKCSVLDDTSAASNEELAKIIVEHLTGRHVSTALEITNIAFWHLSLPKEAIYDALKSWAKWHPEREALLPPTPYEKVQVSSSILGLFRRLLPR